MKFRLLLFLFLSAIRPLAAQNPCDIRITLLTCAPGAELYSIFGHTAIRVQKASTGYDAVYNYGTFPFEEGAGFYIKFIRGKLPYFLSVEPFAARGPNDWGFIDEYRADGRSIWEQELLLDCAQKEALLRALDSNALPQNREYRYDFLFDNCTTRSGQMLFKEAPQPHGTARIIPAEPKAAPTFRNLIHEYLDRGRQPWSRLGIDLLLGARLDRKVSNNEAQFLPEKLMAAMEGATAGGQKLVAPAKAIFEAPPQTGSFSFGPLASFGSLLLLVLVFSFVPARWAQRSIRVFDFVLFFLAGLVGVLLLVMWFATDHTVCADNWNLFWALPTHLLAAPFLRRERRWVNWYLLATIVVLSAGLIGWVFIPQQLNIGFLPIVLLLLARAWLIILKPHYHAPVAESE